jgi:DsbC/DsbD-like thiol-disulfide interchange protein
MRWAIFIATALLAAGGRPPAAQFTRPDPSRTDTKHLTITTSTSTPSAALGERLSLYVDVAPKPKMHVYAPDQTDYYIPISLKMEPASSFKPQAIQYPAAEQFFFEPLKETQRVYSKPFRITLPITLAQNAALPLTIKGTVKYQACDDAICYLPQTVEVNWKLALKK